MAEEDKKTQEAEKATHKLVQAIDQDPYNVDNYYQLGTILTEMQSFPQAEELFKRAINIFNNQPAKVDLLTYGLGNVFYSAGLYDEAIQAFQRVTDHKLKAEAYLMIGQANYAQQKYQQAMVFALTASDEMPQNKEPKRLLADCFLALGKFDQAEDFYQQVLEMDDTDLRALFQLGVIKFTQESPEAADEYFNKVKQLDQDYYDRMQERLRDVQRAIKSKDQDDE